MVRFLRELEQGKATLRMDKVNQVLEMFSSTLVVGEMERDLSYAEGCGLDSCARVRDILMP